MLTKRRNWPLSNSRAVMPLYLAHRSSSTCLTVPPAASTVAWPPVCCRIGAGIWTLIGIVYTLLDSEFAFEIFVFGGLALYNLITRSGNGVNKLRLLFAAVPFEVFVVKIAQQGDRMTSMHQHQV